jgi:hypothetical protein
MSISCSPTVRKGLWLLERGITVCASEEWRKAVFGSRRDRGMVPPQARWVARDSGSCWRSSVRRSLPLTRWRREAAGADPGARGDHAALGEAIGFLHQISEREPDEPAEDRSAGSSIPRKHPSSSS